MKWYEEKKQTFLCLTLGIIIALVIVSAGCISMFSTPTSNTSKLPTTPDINKITPSPVTTKIVTPVTEKKDTMMGKWKESFTNSAYSLNLDIKSESSAEYTMNVKSGKMVNGFMDEEGWDLYEDGDILKNECNLVKKSDGSYSIKAKTCTIIRDGDELISGSGENAELGVITYDKTNDSLKLSSGGETMKMLRTS